jgi:hypothetical protein
VERRALIVAMLALSFVSADAHAAGTWMAPQVVSRAGADVSTGEGDLAVDADGDVLAVWGDPDGKVYGSFRGAGGAFSAPAPIRPDADAVFPAPQAAFDDSGSATVVWGRPETDPTYGAVRRIYVSVRSPSGEFSAPQRISPADKYVQSPRIAVDAAGNALVAWSQGDGLGVAFRPAGGAFEPPTTLGGANDGNNGFDLEFDGHGNVMALWATNVDNASYVRAAMRPLQGSWGLVQTIAGPVAHAGDASLAFDTAGNAVALFGLWDATITDTTKYRPWTSYRPAGGTFDAPQDLSFNNRGNWGTDVAFDPQGRAIAVWSQGFQPQAAIRATNGIWAPGERLSPAAHDSTSGASVAVDHLGNALVMWVGTSSDGYNVRYSLKPADGGFGEMQTLTNDGSASSYFRPVAGFDAQGNAAALWRHFDQSSNELVDVAGYDAAPPQLRSLSVPATGQAGATLPFGVDAVDVWSPFTTTWTFGDSTTATGNETSHVFGAPGDYTATVTATDTLGNTSSRSQGLTVTPPPATIQGPPAPDPAPVLSALTLSPVQFRATLRGASIAAARAGTTVRYRLSESATTRFQVQRATTGRRVGGRCVRTTRRNRRQRPCTRYVTQRGSFKHIGVGGANKLRFTGRLRGRKLAPGRYRLIARATDAAGKSSAVQRVRFQIVRR